MRCSPAALVSASPAGAEYAFTEEPETNRRAIPQIEDIQTTEQEINKPIGYLPLAVPVFTAKIQNATIDVTTLCEANCLAKLRGAVVSGKVPSFRGQFQLHLIEGISVRPS